MSASLRMAVVGPTHPGAGRLASHTVRLAQQLAASGHDVTLVSWSPEATLAPVSKPAGATTFPRTVRSLAWSRPDTWVRTGRRLRAYDTVVIVHTGAAFAPQHLALLRAAGVGRPSARGAGVPRGVLVCDTALRRRPGTAAARALVASVLRTVDGVLVHGAADAALATRLGAARVYTVPQPDRLGPSDATDLADQGPDLGAARIPALAAVEALGATAGAQSRLGPLATRPDEPHLTAAWAEYLGAIEVLAAPEVPAADLHDLDVDDLSDVDDDVDDLDDSHVADDLGGHRDPIGTSGPDAGSRPSPAGRVVRGVACSAGHVARALGHRRSCLELTRADLPDWLLPTDVLDDGWQADEAREEARRLGLPRTRDVVAAWAALGALAAVVRVADDGRHAAVVVDESGAASPLSRWARACGFAPVDLGLTTEAGGHEVLEVDAESLDVVVRVHPGGCDASDIDQAVAAAAWALRPGGLLVLTLPLGRPGSRDAEDALGPADVRAAVARAHDHGFVLVGDLDGEVGRRMRAASVAAGDTPARVPGAAYGLVRLTLRRR